MATSFAVVGPGRVGSALARRWSEAGFRLLGFVGRQRAAIDAALRFAAAGRTLVLDDVHAATFVLVATPDAEVAGVATQAAPRARRCALWLHASGALDLGPLAPLARAGCRIGSLHPLSPFPNAELGYARLAGAPGVLSGEAPALRLLHVLARKAGLVPVALAAADRILYHAACALGTNGVTVLHALVERLFARLDPAVARQLATGAVAAGLGASAAVGGREALSGPVVRGDTTRVQSHLAAMAAADEASLPVYRALMVAAAALAHGRGDLDAEASARIVHLLRDPAPRG